MQKSVSDFFNLSRWVAASAVVLGHIRHLIFPELGSMPHPSLLTKAAYFITGLGHEGVVVFFVISGYLVGGLSMMKMKTKGFDLADYSIHRFSRIYIVLVPALILLGALDIAGMTWFNSSRLYTDSPHLSPDSMNFVIANNVGFGTFIANLAMLEGTYSFSRMGSNAPLWSLVYEWWYYCLFGAAMFIAASTRTMPRALAAIAIFAMCVLLPFPILMWGAIWVMGLLAALYGASKLPKPPIIVGIAVFAVALVAARFGHSANSDEHAAGALVRDMMAASGYIVLLLSLHREGEGLAFSKLHHFLSSFSYSLYIIHFPILVFIVAAGYQVFHFPFGVRTGTFGILYSSAIFVTVCLCAWLCSLVTESKTGQLRRLLHGLILPTTAERVKSKAS